MKDHIAINSSLKSPSLLHLCTFTILHWFDHWHKILNQPHLKKQRNANASIYKSKSNQNQEPELISPKVNLKVYFYTQTCFLIDRILSEFLLFLHKCSIFALEIMIVRMNAITQKKPQSKMKYFPQIVDTPLYWMDTKNTKHKWSHKCLIFNHSGNSAIICVFYNPDMVFFPCR